MSKLLDPPGPGPRIIAPTTTRKMAQRMLSASREIGASLPRGFHTPAPLDIMLVLYIAEDDARYLELNELDVPGALSKSVVERWTEALISEGLIEQRDTLLALSEQGYGLVTSTIEAIYSAQRALD